MPQEHGDRVIEFYIDNRFSDLELAEIQESIKEWDYVLNGNLTLRYGGRHDMEEYILNKNEAVLINKVTSDCTFIPMVKNQVLAFVLGRAIFVIEGRVSFLYLRGVLLHEIGHILGMGHFGETLMRPEYDYTLHYCISKEVVLHISKLWGFEEKSMNYCMRVR